MGQINEHSDSDSDMFADMDTDSVAVPGNVMPRIVINYLFLATMWTALRRQFPIYTL